MRLTSDRPRGDGGNLSEGPEEFYRSNLDLRAWVSLLGEPGPLARGGQIVPEIHLYLTQPPEKEFPPLEGLEDILKRLERVSEARAEPTAWSPYHLRVVGQNNRR